MTENEEDPAVKAAKNSNKRVYGVPFVKGDPRINRRGRKTKDQIGEKKLWQNTFAEYLPDGKGGFVIDEMTGKPITRLQARIRLATGSRNSHEFQLALERAFGKIKDELDVTSAGEKIGKDDSDTRAEILRKLDSIAAATGARGVPVQPDEEAD